MKIKLFYLGLMAACISSCSEHTDISHRTDIKASISGEISNYQTKAVSQHTSSWLENDRIGIFAVSDRTNYHNVAFDYTAEGQFNPVADEIYYQYDNNTLTFTGYYPYKQHDDNNDFEEYTLDTRPQNSSSQDSLDILFADEVTANCNSAAVNLSFIHKMAKVKLNFTAGDGVIFSDISDNFTELKLSNVKHDGTFNVRTGALSLAGDASVVNDLVVDATASSTADTYTYTIYVIPQQLANFTITAEINGNTYRVSLTPHGDVSPSFDPSTIYSYDLTVHKNGIEVSGESTITDWSETDMGDHDIDMVYTAP